MPVRYINWVLLLTVASLGIALLACGEGETREVRVVETVVVEKAVTQVEKGC